jgi:hypothetical protein
MEDFEAEGSRRSSFAVDPIRSKPSFAGILEFGVDSGVPP